MTTLTPVKLTDAERDLIDWLVHTTGLLSRSAVLRSAMLDLARRSGVPGELLRRVSLARLTSPPRSAQTPKRRAAITRQRRAGGPG